MAPDDWIVKTFVVGFPITKANIWPALKKYSLMGIPIGMLPREKVNGGGPDWDAVSVCARTACVVALTTLMMVPETVPLIVAVPEKLVAGGGVSAESPPLLQESRPSPMNKRRPLITALQAHFDCADAFMLSR